MRVCIALLHAANQRDTRTSCELSAFARPATTDTHPLRDGSTMTTMRLHSRIVRDCEREREMWESYTKDEGYISQIFSVVFLIFRKQHANSSSKASFEVYVQGMLNLYFSSLGRSKKSDSEINNCIFVMRSCDAPPALTLKSSNDDAMIITMFFNALGKRSEYYSHGVNKLETNT